MALMNLSQGRKRDADVESGPVDTAGGGEGGCVESRALAYTHRPVQAIGSSRASSSP